MTPKQAYLQAQITIALLEHRLAASEALADAWRDRCKSAEHIAEAVAAGAADDLQNAGFRADLPPSIAAVFAGCPNA